VLSRNEHDAKGEVQYKRVEEVFKRFSAVWELRVGGQLILTTGEHPFFRDREWVAAQELQVGDKLLCQNGSTITVEGLRETGNWVPVYNLRVADWHTYFVGDDSWGFGLWAHDISCEDLAPIVSAAGNRSSIVHTIQKVVDSSAAIKPRLIWGTVESLMDTLLKLQTDGKPGLADYQDGKVLHSFLAKIPSQFKAGATSGNYYVLYLASQLSAAGHRVSIEQSFTPNPGRADLIDHTQRLAMEAKYMSTTSATKVAKEIAAALTQISGATGHAPPVGYSRRVQVQLASIGNEMLGMTKAQIVTELVNASVDKSSFGNDPAVYPDIRILRPDGTLLATIERADLPDPPVNP
jgi:hypothetical protein